MKIVSNIAATLALSACWSYASADATAEIAGIRVIGQAMDGTLVLDDSVSGLSNWATPGLAMPGSEPVEAAPTLLVIGHVESFDAATGVLTVSGQRTTLTEGATVIDAPRDIDATLTAENLIWYLQEGRYIAVAGDTFGGGENLATHVVRLDNEVQPGTAPIYVRGSLDLVDEIQGIAYIGGMALDLNSATGPQAPITTGNVVEVLAYQADASSAVVSDYSSLETSSIRATGWSKLAGISGTGAKAKGISGTGAKAKGISGTGAKAKGISGTGAKAKGISGTGAKAKGISGTGAKAKGISGTGAKAKGISGTGAKAKGISGTGAKAKGISGTGAKAKGISGTGAKAKGISPAPAPRPRAFPALAPRPRASLVLAPSKFTLRKSLIVPHQVTVALERNEGAVTLVCILSVGWEVSRVVFDYIDTNPNDGTLLLAHWFIGLR